MKTAIKMFPEFGWIEARKSKISKIWVFKVDYFNLPIFFVPKLKSVAQSEWKKTAIYIFSIFGSKSNELEQEKSEKNPQIFKQPKSCRQRLIYAVNFFQEKLSHEL